MARIFRSGKENTAAGYEYPARISTQPERKRSPSRSGRSLQLQSFPLGLSRPGLCRETLVVPAPRRVPFLARSRDPGAQTIQFVQEML